MFGTIMPKRKDMGGHDRERYAKCYCGLCHQLDIKFSRVGTATLTYDMTFLSMLLGSIYNLPETDGSDCCIRHPIKPHPYAITDATNYAADLNLILAYYQCIDDWKDDGNRKAHQRSQQMEHYISGIRERWPKQCDAIDSGIRRIGEMERVNELNPDLPANCCGEILGELFVWKNDEHTKALYSTGAALGRFIYLFDAVNDLRADLKKQRYNPLIAQMETDFTPILTMMMGECTSYFESLSLHRDQNILHNILFVGVWQRYRKHNIEEG